LVAWRSWLDAAAGDDAQFSSGEHVMASIREKDDDYGNIVAQLGPKHRVIVCCDNYQWIAQYKSGIWRSHHFCTSREGVIRRVKGLPGWETLLDLPDRFKARQIDAVARAGREIDPSGHTPTSVSETGSVRGTGEI
jgi:hypothetical protein